MNLLEAKFSMTVGGRAATSKRRLPAWNPASKDLIARVPDASRGQLDAAVAAARSAFPTWSRTPTARRQNLLRQIAEAIERHAEAFMALLTREQGKRRAAA